MTVENEEILLSNNSNESKKIAVWLIILRKSTYIKIKQFLKFKMQVFKYLIRKKLWLRRIKKTFLCEK